MGKTRTASADAGNNALKMMIDGNEPIVVPSTYAYNIGDATEQFEQADIPEDKLLENLDVTISSKALNQNNVRYYVGDMVIQNQIKGNEYEKLSDKSTDEIPVILTLSALAVDAMKREPGKDHIKATYDLALALPVVTITQESARKNSERFMGTHEVIFHHPSGRDVTTEVTIVFCKCIPEGAAGAWGVVYDEKGNISYRDVEINDEVKSINFADKLILHFDIGAGTSEVVVTDGVQYKPRMSEGLGYGTKETINDIIKRWNKKYPRKSINGIAEYNDIYFNTEHPRHTDLREESKLALKNLAIQLGKVLIDKIDDMKDEPYTFIYGGGSIIIKSYLEEILRSKGRLKNVIFLNDPINVNARGLLVFALSPLFAKAKKDYLAIPSK